MQVANNPAARCRPPLRGASTAVLAAVLLLAGTGCAQRQAAVVAAAAPTAPSYASLEILNATLYQQTAAEYRALTRQVYDQAIARLDDLLQQTAVTAALEQQPPFAQLPPAVIVDIDETILDNAPFEARLIRSGATFEQSEWGRWVHEAAAPPIPGALEFVQACAAKGVTVIWLSNRTESEAEATRRNLARLEFPQVGDLEHFLFRPEDRNAPLYSKGARRSMVASRYRVLMLVGDNLGDFTEQFRVPLAQRAAAVDQHRARFGHTWFMLPNAMYGSWDDALLDFNRDLDDQTRHQRKQSHLDPAGLGVLGQPQER